VKNVASVHKQARHAYAQPDPDIQNRTPRHTVRVAAVTPGAKNRELAEGIEEQKQRQAGERLGPLDLNADQEIDEIDRHQDRKREKKTDQKLPRGAGIFRGIALD
jgi:hypothetical protein